MSMRLSFSFFNLIKIALASLDRHTPIFPRKRTGLQEYMVCTSSSGNHRETALVFYVGEDLKLEK
jgi:hypothetical protein